MQRLHSYSMPALFYFLYFRIFEGWGNSTQKVWYLVSLPVQTGFEGKQCRPISKKQIFFENVSACTHRVWASPKTPPVALNSSRSPSSVNTSVSRFSLQSVLIVCPMCDEQNPNRTCGERHEKQSSNILYYCFPFLMIRKMSLWSDKRRIQMKKESFRKVVLEKAVTQVCQGDQVQLFCFINF